MSIKFPDPLCREGKTQKVIPKEARSSQSAVSSEDLVERKNDAQASVLWEIYYV